MKRTLHGLLAFLAVFLLAVPAALAQVDRATLSGVVRDTGGGVVPGATVTVTNIATNLESHQTTTEVGGYQIVNLIPGRYQVEVELSGGRDSFDCSTGSRRASSCRRPSRRRRGQAWRRCARKRAHDMSRG